MDNQQLYNLTNNQLQVLLTAKLGDGHLSTPKNINSNSYYCTNCIHKEYLEYKKTLLGELSHNIGYVEHNGYSQTPIYTLVSKHDVNITKIFNLSIEECLNNIDELGIALWIYDDGSLHQNKYFYNINTHKFSKDIQEELFIPFFNKYNIFPKITKEVKKDGRVFYYLRISKYEGSYEINKILQKYPVDCYKYKLWSSETIQSWSRFLVKSKNRTIFNPAGYTTQQHYYRTIDKIVQRLIKGENFEDIVQSLEKSKAGIKILNKLNELV